MKTQSLTLCIMVVRVAMVKNVPPSMLHNRVNLIEESTLGSKTLAAKQINCVPASLQGWMLCFSVDTG